MLDTNYYARNLSGFFILCHVRVKYGSGTFVWTNISKHLSLVYNLQSKFILNIGKQRAMFLNTIILWAYGW